jgi:ketosteroid isomerase-like protein
MAIFNVRKHRTSQHIMKYLVFTVLLTQLSGWALTLGQKGGTQMAPTSEAERAVLQVEEERVQALLHKDLAALDRIMAEESIHTESSGKVRTKAQFIAAFKAGEFAFDAFDVEENNVRIYGETAVVTGRYSNRIRAGGVALPLKRARHLRVYVMREGRWQLVAHQATEIAS